MHLLLLFLLLPFVSSQIDTEYFSNEKTEEDLKLTMIDPIAVGHERTFYLDTGRSLNLKTLAVHPPIFAIDDFLTEAECEYIVNLAVNTSNWKESATIPKDTFTLGAKEGERQFDFKTTDTNDDDLVDFMELWAVMPPIQNYMITIEDIPEFVQLHNYDVDGDETLTREEFDQIDVKLAYEWMIKKGENNHRNTVRKSKQVWLNPETDTVLSLLTERITSVTGIPKRIIDSSKEFQIVHYDIGGHYHAHYDSTFVDERSCIHTREIDGVDHDQPDDFTKYRICRYATIMYYLNDVDEGGDTAFPVADNETFSCEVSTVFYYNLSHHCKDANLLVKPSKGKVVFWYNHETSEDGWLGSQDPYSLHGGCDIVKGTKWIANHFVTVDSDKERQLRSMDISEEKKKSKNTAGVTEESTKHEEINEHQHQIMTTNKQLEEKDINEEINQEKLYYSAHSKKNIKI
ncbi:transmembrane prolyl 4-hydroxylase-like [Antedon mediterranea]|uniref:transmembrane prolyl 4-hydroxylase-like n=1 Tax=Antedon mediterranea TaxID=105859 RepID=UPI003AF5EAEC